MVPPESTLSTCHDSWGLLRDKLSFKLDKDNLARTLGELGEQEVAEVHLCIAEGFEDKVTSRHIADALKRIIEASNSGGKDLPGSICSRYGG
jgi:hypothetical protein